MNIKRNITKFNKTRQKKYRHKLCHAPGHSLSFLPLGSVKTCCVGFNSIGKWPLNSIRDILTNKKLESINLSLQNNKFPQNCRHCLSNISLNNFNNAMLKIYDKEQILRSGINHFDFTLENTCNLQCIMCGAHRSDKHEVNHSSHKHYNQDFVDEIKPYLSQIHFANFSGGEPFLIDIYYQIWDYLINKNPDCQMHILTNGTILNDKIKQILNKGNFSFSISIDALQKELYEHIRRNASFEKTMKNLDFFIEYSKRNKSDIFLNACPMINNWQEIPKIAKFTKQKGIGFSLNQVITPFNLSLWTLSKSRLKEIYHYLKAENPFSKSENSYNDYEGLLIDIKAWMNKDKLINNLHQIDKQTFINKLNQVLQNKLNLKEETAKILFDNIIKYDNKYLTRELIAEFECLPDDMRDFFKKDINNSDSLNFYITYLIYFSVFNKLKAYK